MRQQTFVKAALALSCFIQFQTVLAQQAPEVLAASAKKLPARDMTLADFRKDYLNQRIVILKGNDAGRGSLGGWEPMKADSHESFKNDFSKGAFIALGYKDEIPKVVWIGENTVAGFQPAKEGQKNAMGETITADDIVNPSVTVIVQFDDGQLAQYSSIVSLITDNSVKNTDQDLDDWDMEFMLASVRDEHAKALAQILPTMIGQKVYAVHDTLMFGVDVAPTDFVDLGKREAKRVQSFPLLTGMTIIAAKYNERYDFTVFKLQSDDGQEFISAARFRERDGDSDGDPNPLVARVIGSLLLQIPSALTPQEIAAINVRKIFRGMSRRAVTYSWGAATENDYGKGGKQLVYGSDQMVYLDNKGKVTDLQSLNK